MRYIASLCFRFGMVWLGSMMITSTIASDEIDVSTIIARIKYYDSLIESGRGNCVLENHFYLQSRSTKAEYLFVFGRVGEDSKIKVMYHKGGPKKNMVQIFDGEKQWEIYDHEVKNKKLYGVRYHFAMSPTLDPRFWQTYGDRDYLTVPLWKLLEKYESQIIGVEQLNGNDCYVIQVKRPSSRSFKVWVSPQQGFRPIKIENRFVTAQPPVQIRKVAGLSDVTSENIVTKELSYRKYADDIWFLHKGKTTLVESLSEPKRGENMTESKVKTVRETHIRIKDFKLNIDVLDQLRPNIPNEALIFDHNLRKALPASELLK